MGTFWITDAVDQKSPYPCAPPSRHRVGRLHCSRNCCSYNWTRKLQNSKSLNRSRSTRSGKVSVPFRKFIKFLGRGSPPEPARTRPTLSKTRGIMPGPRGNLLFLCQSFWNYQRQPIYGETKTERERGTTKKW